MVSGNAALRRLVDYWDKKKTREVAVRGSLLINGKTMQKS